MAILTINNERGYNMKKQFSRRDFIKAGTIALGALAVYDQSGAGKAVAAEVVAPKVYFTKGFEYRGDDFHLCVARLTWLLSYAHT